MFRDYSEIQKEICAKYHVIYVACPHSLKIGISENVKSDVIPINGLRYQPEGGMTGWYIWAGGEIPQDNPHFFVPLHVAHLEKWCPQAIRFLGLPPGWRFLIADGHEDVWKDSSLLDK